MATTSLALGTIPYYYNDPYVYGSSFWRVYTGSGSSWTLRGSGSGPSASTFSCPSITGLSGAEVRIVIGGVYHYDDGEGGGYDTTGEWTYQTSGLNASSFSAATWSGLPVAAGIATTTVTNITYVSAAPPAAPTIGSSSKITGAVRVPWTKSSTATGYEVWRNTSNANGTGSGVAQVADLGDVATWDDTSITSAGTYYYWVKAKNTNGTSGFSGVTSQTVALPTVSASGTFDSKTLGAGIYGEVRIKASGVSGTAPSDVHVYRASTSGGTYTEITAHCVITDPVSDEFLILDTRPAYGTPVIPLGSTAYYKVTIQVLSALTSVATSQDKDAAIRARLALMLSYQQAQSGQVIHQGPEPEVRTPWYSLAYFAYGYFLTSDAAYLSALRRQYAYCLSIMSGDLESAVSDHHGRATWWLYAASRLVRRAGVTADADTMVAKADAMVAAYMGLFGSRTGAQNWQGLIPAYQSSHAYVYGDVVWVNNTDKRMTCTTAGTTSGTPPTWPATAGATVADGTVVWTKGATSFTWRYLSVDGAGNPVPSYYNDFEVPNQQLWICAVMAELYNDPGATYTYHNASCLFVIDNHVRITFNMQRHAPTDLTLHGRLPWDGATLGYVTTGYHKAVLLTLALIEHAMGTSWNPLLGNVIDRGLDYLGNNWNAEPNISWHLSAPDSHDANGVEWERLIRQLHGRAFPLGDLAWTSAFCAVDGSGDVAAYTGYGIPSGGQGVVVPPTFEGNVAFWPLDGPAFENALIAFPMEPSAVSAAYSGGNVNVGWTDNSTDETGFIIQRGVDGGAWADCTDASTSSPAAANATTFQDHHLPGSWTTLKYRVAATNASGTSAWAESGTLQGEVALTGAVSGGGSVAAMLEDVEQFANAGAAGAGAASAALGVDAAIAGAASGLGSAAAAALDVALALDTQAAAGSGSVAVAADVALALGVQAAAGLASVSWAMDTYLMLGVQAPAGVSSISSEAEVAIALGAQSASGTGTGQVGGLEGAEPGESGYAPGLIIGFM